MYSIYYVINFPTKRSYADADETKIAEKLASQPTTEKLNVQRPREM